MTFNNRIAYARGYTGDLLKRIWLFVIIGIGLGAWIHGYIPADFLAKYAGRGNWFALPAAFSRLLVAVLMGTAGSILKESVAELS